MISHLRGRMIEKTPTHVILECNGVGYHLEVSLHTFSGLSSEEEQLLYTHLQIKEDSHTLFGFLSEFERAVFRLLISVSGVGAATARTMLSSLSPSDVVGAIASEQVAVVQSVKGIGAKTAQRMILELKDKVLALEGAEDVVANTTVKGQNGEEAIAALEVLGFTRKSVQKIVDKLLTADSQMSVEDLIKNTLNAI
ncbi:MAG: Holliday junction branch migration protein RuvA [Flavobacteriaceae bacterium]|jgi:Holliday junction DNA helicase RuvA